MRINLRRKRSFAAPFDCEAEVPLLVATGERVGHASTVVRNSMAAAVPADTNQSFSLHRGEDRFQLLRRHTIRGGEFTYGCEQWFGLNGLYHS
jgi:hypothetical protein